jgi:hypothetical protein
VGGVGDVASGGGKELELAVWVGLVVGLCSVHESLQAPTDVLDHAGELIMARWAARAELEPALVVVVVAAVQREDVEVGATARSWTWPTRRA